MISYLRGKVKIKSDKYVILDVAGVGYQIFVSPVVLKELGDKEEIELLRAYEAGEMRPVPNQEKLREEMRQAAINTLKLRKSANLNLRLAPQTVLGLKKRAQKAGMRYQTMVGILLEQFAAGKITLTL